MNKLEKLHRPHSKYWDCYNDEPLKENHAKKSAKISKDVAIKFAFWVETSMEAYDYFKKNKIYPSIEGNKKQHEKEYNELFEIFINNHYE